MFRSAPEVKKRIHSKLFRKFWEEPGYKRANLHYCIGFPSFSVWFITERFEFKYKEIKSTNSSVGVDDNIIQKGRSDFCIFRENTIEWTGYFKQHWYLDIDKIQLWNSKDKLIHLDDYSIGCEISKEMILSITCYLEWNQC